MLHLATVCVVSICSGVVMKKLFAAICFSALVALSGCTYTAPMQAVQGQMSKADKEGHATCTWIFGFVSDDDCSLKTAAQNGGIEEIIAVDVKHTNVLYIFRKQEVIVHGK